MPSKPIFLLDENLTYTDNKYYSPPFFKSTDLLYKGATDDVIFRYSLKNGMIIITKDKRFALDIILSGNKVVVINDDYKVTLVDPKVDVNSKYFSPVTYYILENDCVVIP